MRLIDADDLTSQVWFVQFQGTDIDKISEQIIKQCKEIVRTAPQVVGQWEERYIKDDDCPWTRRRFYCSHCGKWQTYGRTKFCPNCGAKMEVKK